jgi:hypothetical protein
MKRSWWLFILIVGNLLFIGVALYWMRSSQTGGSAMVSNSVSNVRGNVLLSIPAPAALPAITVTNDFQWAQLESEDYHEYIERLRKIGCPEETIRDIIIADIEKLFAPRLSELRSNTNEPKYWRADDKDLINHLEALQQLKKKRGVDYEKRQVIRDLLGVDLVAERLSNQGEEDFYGKRLGKSMAPDKLDQLRVIIEESNHQEMDVREKSWLEGESLTPGDKQQLRLLEKEKQQQIAALLSPEELDQYNLWFSTSAYKARDSLLGMDASEQEFLALYQLRREFDNRWGNTDPESLNPAQRQAWNASLDEMERNIQQTLGPDRYQSYLRAQDNDYRQARVTAAEFNLPANAAEEVYGFKQVFLEQRQALLAQTAVSDVVKQQTIKTMQEETQQAIIETIGGKAYQFYRRTGGGQWLTEP